MIFYGIFGFLTVLTFLIIMWFTYSDRSEISKIPLGLEDYILVQRFLNSPSCFAFQDEDTGRIYPNILDLEKLNKVNLDNCYNIDNTNMKAYRLTIDHGKNKITLNTKNWEGFLKKAETEYIFIKDNGEIKPAKLFIEVQNAK
ncbi:MAG: hypothetical protein QF917_00105 [Candidatus Woesearchaeota archaeon]|nr:hypothetical protein [Candidatus Woesearchaeota archaeon]